MLGIQSSLQQFSYHGVYTIDQGELGRYHGDGCGLEVTMVKCVVTVMTCMCVVNFVVCLAVWIPW
jgi:hypothetical protein